MRGPVGVTYDLMNRRFGRPQEKSYDAAIRTCPPREQPYMKHVLRLQVAAGIALSSLAGYEAATMNNLDLQPDTGLLRAAEAVANTWLHAPFIAVAGVMGTMAVEAAVSLRHVGEEADPHQVDRHISPSS